MWVHRGDCLAGREGRGKAGEVHSPLPGGAHPYWRRSAPSRCLLTCIFFFFRRGAARYLTLHWESRILASLVAAFPGRVASGEGNCLPPEEDSGQVRVGRAGPRDVQGRATSLEAGKPVLRRERAARGRATAGMASNTERMMDPSDYQPYQESF